MNLEIPNGQKPYLHHVARYKADIKTAKLQWQISTIEGVIETMIYPLIIKQTNDEWIANRHRDELLTECLIKRCDLLAADENKKSKNYKNN